MKARSRRVGMITKVARWALSTYTGDGETTEMIAVIGNVVVGLVAAGLLFSTLRLGR
jgi:hypothetical protein